MRVYPFRTVLCHQVQYFRSRSLRIAVQRSFFSEIISAYCTRLENMAADIARMLASEKEDKALAEATRDIALAEDRLEGKPIPVALKRPVIPGYNKGKGNSRKWRKGRFVPYIVM